MKKVAYTAIFGDYDKLKEPSVISEGWDYYLITDNTEITSDVYKIIYIDLNLSDVKNARFCKINFWEFILGYDIYLWVDASLQINTNLNEFISQYDSDIVLMRHPDRTCLYDEASAVIRLGIDKPEVINPQLERYRDLGFPIEYGLGATGVLLRRATRETKEFMQDWWLEVYDGSHRDQLSFDYTRWLHKDNVDVILIDRYWEFLERGNGQFRYTHHGK